MAFPVELVRFGWIMFSVKETKAGSLTVLPTQSDFTTAGILMMLV